MALRHSLINTLFTNIRRAEKKEKKKKALPRHFENQKNEHFQKANYSSYITERFKSFILQYKDGQLLKTTKIKILIDY